MNRPNLLDNPYQNRYNTLAGANRQIITYLLIKSG